MFKKVVMWKIKAEGNGISRRKTAEKIKAKLDNLSGIIHVITNLEVGINTSLSNECYNLVLISEFDNHEDMIIFREHHEYQKIHDYMEPLVVDKKVVEYEI